MSEKNAVLITAFSTRHGKNFLSWQWIHIPTAGSINTSKCNILYVTNKIKDAISLSQALPPFFFSVFFLLTLFFFSSSSCCLSCRCFIILKTFHHFIQFLFHHNYLLKISFDILIFLNHEQMKTSLVKQFCRPANHKPDHHWSVGHRLGTSGLDYLLSFSSCYQICNLYVYYLHTLG